MLELIVGGLLWTIKDASKSLITSMQHFAHRCMPDEARDGRNVALNCCDLLACLIFQSNHPIAHTNMYVELISQNDHLIEKAMLTWYKHAHYTVPA